MNTIIKIENGRIYTKSSLNERNDIFEVVAVERDFEIKLVEVTNK